MAGAKSAGIHLEVTHGTGTANQAMDLNTAI